MTDKELPMPNPTFYLGRIFDPKTGKTTKQTVQYDPADLTTHAVVTGMTGSGKTGLCISLLEEAALQGIPALVIDPKGDLTNLLLHFPDLAPGDFQPWIDAEEARRAGKSIEQAAQTASETWRNGLKEWGVPKERLLALKDSVDFVIFTPGSDSGQPINVLSSLNAPDLSWDQNREVIRERIITTVTALLGLVGYKDIDPVRSREHILLANIFESSWSQGKNVELSELILQTQNPPFEKLGAFPVDTFFPAKDRMDLAMSLNSILASPAFEAWRNGQALDIQALLNASDGRPRHSIFYIAHLTDAERMFFVTLLLSALETWIRTQSGVSSLRAILYFDELYGYLPPVANPASKQPLLRMLKMARAFGLGILLATQNPVDVDYKGLSNAGTWFIGKLQTDRDKQRLLDGLENATGGISRATMDRLISSLGKRVFVLHNVHTKEPILFQTRWAMNFLAGPLTRNQIPQLNKLAGARAVVSGRPKREEKVQVSQARTLPSSNLPSSSTKPPVPTGIREIFVQQTYSLPEAFSAANRSMAPGAEIAGVVYQPSLAALAQVRLLDRKFGVDTEIKRAVLVPQPDRRGVVHWEDFGSESGVLENADSLPVDSARFGSLEPPLNDSRLMTALQKDFTEWIYRNTSVIARSNPALKVFAGPELSQADFMKACADAAREGRDAEIAKKGAQLDRQIKTLESKLGREERELREDESDLQHRKWEEMGTHAENVLGLFTKSRSSRRLSSSLSKRRLTENAKADVEESVEAMAQYKRELADLTSQREILMKEINERWGSVVNDVKDTTIKAKKTVVFVSLFAVAWLPFYLVKAGRDTFELAAFGG